MLSKLRYLYCIWGNTTKGNSKIIEGVIRSAGRFVLKQRKYDEVKENITEKLNWLFPKHLYTYEILKVAYDLFNNCCPDYFKDYLNLEDVNVNVMSTRGKDYTYILSENNKPIRILSEKITHEWFTIPEVIRKIKTKGAFNNKLKQYLIEKQKT